MNNLYALMLGYKLEFRIWLGNFKIGGVSEQGMLFNHRSHAFGTGLNPK